MLEHFPPFFDDSRLFVPRSRRRPRGIQTVQAFPFPANLLPWRWIGPSARRHFKTVFSEALSQAGGEQTVVYCWPSPSLDLLDQARQTGSLLVREMINSYTGTARPILDHAFESAGLRPDHGITSERVEAETEELARYDYVFSSNAEVDKSLRAAGIESSRIIKTTFGWSPARFNRHGHVKKAETFTVLFVGTIGVRKGVVQLLQAWKRAAIPGRLILAGHVEDSIKPLLQAYADDSSIEFLAYADDIEVLYKSSHVFAFPTFEEGGPQVTYEAAGCGLPALTTPMGAGRLTRHGENGLIVAAGDVDALAEGLRIFYEDPDGREAMGHRAQTGAARFAYPVVGAERGRALAQLLTDGALPKSRDRRTG